MKKVTAESGKAAVDERKKFESYLMITAKGLMHINDEEHPYRNNKQFLTLLYEHFEAKGDSEYAAVFLERLENLDD